MSGSRDSKCIKFSICHLRRERNFDAIELSASSGIPRFTSEIAPPVAFLLAMQYDTPRAVPHLLILVYL